LHFLSPIERLFERIELRADVFRAICSVGRAFRTVERRASSERETPEVARTRHPIPTAMGNLVFGPRLVSR